MKSLARSSARRRRFPTPETGATDERTPLRLAVGDIVVYGFHGVALIAASEGDAAAPTAVVLEFTSGLRVTLPSAWLRSQLSHRPVPRHAVAPRSP